MPLVCRLLTRVRLVAFYVLVLFCLHFFFFFFFFGDLVLFFFFFFLCSFFFFSYSYKIKITMASKMLEKSTIISIFNVTVNKVIMHLLIYPFRIKICILLEIVSIVWLQGVEKFHWNQI